MRNVVDYHEKCGGTLPVARWLFMRGLVVYHEWYGGTW